jgi:uncharacterized protein (DUF4213/DUF364 family)
MDSLYSSFLEDFFSQEIQFDEYSVSDIVIGMRYTGVLLSNGILGLSYTLYEREQAKETQDRYLKEKFLSNKSLLQLVSFCSSEFSIFRSLGFAALNAFSQSNLPLKSIIKSDIKDLFLTKSPSVVGMIGNIHPITQFLTKKDFKIRVLDKFSSPSPSSHITPVTNIDDLLNVDHLIVSGSALVFDNFPQILSLIPTISGERIFIGPSAQILPQIAFKYGFTFLASSKVTDIKSTLLTLKEGGSYRSFKAYLQKYCFRSTDFL